MKANELMIGDKVMVKVLSQIPDTYVPHTWTANDYSRDIQVKPIPITPEMLEKNEDVKSLTMFRKNEQGIDCLALIYIPAINLYYVHELQRALRLCGLNELADNFKV